LLGLDEFIELGEGSLRNRGGAPLPFKEYARKNGSGN
jgi:hypothetical protein